MKMLINLTLLFFGLTVFSAAQSPEIIDIEKTRGYASSILIDEAIATFNRNNKTSSVLTIEEFKKAVNFELSEVNENNEKSYRLLLMEMVEKNKLPKGSLIFFRKYENYEVIMMVFGMDLQPKDQVPEPGSINLIKRLPIRIDFR